MFTATERLYYTSDRTKIVRHGDVDAAFLFLPVGGETSDAEAQALGLHNLDEARIPTEAKAVAPADNKAIKAASNK